MQAPQPGWPPDGWWKSSYSAEGANCLLVRRADRIRFADSHTPGAPILDLPFREWAVLLGEVKGDRL